MNDERKARICELNDQLRQTGIGGRVMVTRGLLDQGPSFVARTICSMRAFNEFAEDDDPYGEHDFGALRVDAKSVFWKIDYYDASMTAGAEDPSDPKTCRVLTVMLAEEY